MPSSMTYDYAINDYAVGHIQISLCYINVKIIYVCAYTLQI